MQGFSKCTRSDISEAMLGLNRLSSLVDKEKLMFLHKILTLPSRCITKDIFLRKYFLYVSCKSLVTHGFIPDVCNILQKYSLTTIVNTYISEACELPRKHVWKSIVNNAIYLKESDLWNQRMSGDTDFIFFRVLHPVIQPCIVYSVIDESSSRHLSKTVANLWCRAPIIERKYCQLCGNEHCEELIHVLTECKSTERLREGLKTNILNNHGNQFLHELLELDTFGLALRLLGAPLPPVLDQESEKMFLSYTFRFIWSSLNIL